MHPRDAAILALARRLLGPRTRFEDVVSALERAVVRTIPAGRVFVIGQNAHGPIVGSAISNVGVAARAGGVDVVRVVDGRAVRLAVMAEQRRAMVVR